MGKENILAINEGFISLGNLRYFIYTGKEIECEFIRDYCDCSGLQDSRTKDMLLFNNINDVIAFFIGMNVTPALIIRVGDLVSLEDDGAISTIKKGAYEESPVKEYEASPEENCCDAEPIKVSDKLN